MRALVLITLFASTGCHRDADPRLSAAATLASAATAGPTGDTGSAGPAGPSTGLPAAGCGSGDVLQWTGSAWICAPDAVATSSADITSLGTPAGSGTAGGGALGVVTLRLIDCPTDGNILRFAGGQWSCSVDRTMPPAPAGITGPLGLTNTCAAPARTAASALSVSTIDATGTALSVTNNGEGVAARLIGDSDQFDRGQLSVRDSLNTESGITMETANLGARWELSTTFGASAQLQVSHNGGAPLFTVSRDGQTNVPRLALGMSSATFNGGANGAFVVGVTGIAGSPGGPTCDQTCTLYGFQDCIGSWTVGAANPPTQTCISQFNASSVGVCFCTYN